MLLLYPCNALANGFRELPGAVRENLGKGGLRAPGPASNGLLEFVQVLLN